MDEKHFVDTLTRIADAFERMANALEIIECQSSGGHAWSGPPETEVCRHCGAWRRGATPPPLDERGAL